MIVECVRYFHRSPTLMQNLLRTRPENRLCIHGLLL